MSEVSRAARTSAACATGSERSTRQLYDVRLGLVELREGVPADEEEEEGSSASPQRVSERGGGLDEGRAHAYTEQRRTERGRGSE